MNTNARTWRGCFFALLLCAASALAQETRHVVVGPSSANRPTANQPPTVRVTAPAEGAELKAGAPFTAIADAQVDAGRRIVKVQFFVWSRNLRVGEATAAPWSAEAKPRDVFARARFSLIARATDDTGAATDSEPVWLTMSDDAEYPPRAKAREERFISAHNPGSGHEGIPCLAEAPNGDLLCVFYAGKYELSDDSAIYLTRLPRGAAQWQKPRRIIGGDDGISRANAVLHVGKDGALTCFYSNIEGGRNFEYARPCFRTSRDGGATWSTEQRMPEPKFTHPTGTLFALKPLRLADGTLLLPANRESEHPDPKRGWTSLFYRSTDDGRTWTETAEILSTPGNIQPAIQQLSDGSLLGLFRPRGRNGKLWRSTSRDGGMTWAPLEKTTLDNPSTRSDFVVLPSGKIVLACNVAPMHRTPVNVLLSDDLGKTWRVNRAIETGPGPYGYCAVLRTRDGKVHIAYDCDRRVIKHVVVDEAWFDEPEQRVDYVRP
jgi:predicted neuraminidase